MNQSIKHDAPCDGTTAHNVRSHLTSHRNDALQAETKRADKNMQINKNMTRKKKWLYLFQCHNTHQLSNTGDIGMTETQQGEQSVGLSNEREEDIIQSVSNVS